MNQLQSRKISFRTYNQILNHEMNPSDSDCNEVSARRFFVYWIRDDIIDPASKRTIIKFHDRMQFLELPLHSFVSQLHS